MKVNKVWKQEHLKWKYMELCFSVNIIECVLKAMGYFLHIMFCPFYLKLTQAEILMLSLCIHTYMHIKSVKIFRKMKNATNKSIYNFILFMVKSVFRRSEVCQKSSKFRWNKRQNWWKSSSFLFFFPLKNYYL